MPVERDNPMSTLLVMPTFGEVIRAEREARGMSIFDLGKKVGLQGATISRKERGELAIKPNERGRFAEALGTTERDLLAKTKVNPAMVSTSLKGVPVLNRAPAGMVTDYHVEHIIGREDEASEYLARDDNDDPHAFALIVVGDSMKPTCSNLDYIIFTPMKVAKPRVQLRNGMIVAVWMEGASKHKGVTIGRWSKAGDSVTLLKDNPDFPPITVDAADVQSVAVAVEIRRKLV